MNNIKLDSWVFEPDNLGELLDDMWEDYVFFLKMVDLNHATVGTSCTPTNTKIPPSTCSDNAANRVIPSFTKSNHAAMDTFCPIVPSIPKSSSSACPPLPTVKRDPVPNKRKLCENVDTDSSCSTTMDSSVSTSSDEENDMDDMIKTNINTFVQVEDNDVLFGRGGRSNGHPGNQRYRHCILDYQRAYKTLDVHGKRALIQVVVYWVELQGGRFLARDKTSKGSGRYYVASDKEVHEKVSQALREDHTPEGRALKKSRLTCKE